MGADVGPRERRGKRLKATARFVSIYGRLPCEFDPETAMGLYANIPTLESESALVTARAIAMAMGDSKSLAHAVYTATGNSRIATRIEVQASLARGEANG